MLGVMDTKVDRYRAEKRQSVVVEHLAEIRSLGSFSLAAKYLINALLAFQNLDEGIKAQLPAIYQDYQAQNLPDDIKYLALGFVFLTIVGEEHFAAVLRNAKQVQVQGASPPPPPPPVAPPPPPPPPAPAASPPPPSP
jgi:hypothetical protein